MLDLDKATNVVKKNLPNGVIKWSVDYHNLFVFQVFDKDLTDDEQLDPFYSVEKKTGKFMDFSIITADHKYIEQNLKRS
jgi:hypothetical protein